MVGSSVQTLLQLHPLWLIAMIAALLFDIIYPLVLAFVVSRRLKISWRYFGYGALIFVLFQLISRVPIISVIQTLIAAPLQTSRALLIVWIAISAITAGLCEEIGRYVGYRWLMKREEKTWSKAVMYGLGHGGIESMLLVGGLVVITLINLIALTQIDLDALPISPEQHTQIVQQFDTINAQPTWVPLLGAWERLWTVPVHIAFSVIVLQVFRRNSISWLWLAIGAHSLVDLVIAGLPALVGFSGLTALLVPEALVAICGMIAIWVIWRLREPAEEQHTVQVVDDT